MHRYVVDLNIPAVELLRYYRGAASTVLAHDQYGRRLRFPGAALRPLVTGGGVHGRFVLAVGEGNRLQRIDRLPE